MNGIERICENCSGNCKDAADPKSCIHYGDSSFAMTNRLLSLEAERDEAAARADRYKELYLAQRRALGQAIENEKKARELADRYRKALSVIARGNISPGIRFAQRVLDGEDPSEALKKEIEV